MLALCHILCDIPVFRMCVRCKSTRCSIMQQLTVILKCMKSWVWFDNGQVVRYTVLWFSSAVLCQHDIHSTSMISGLFTAHYTVYLEKPVLSGKCWTGFNFKSAPIIEWVLDHFADKARNTCMWVTISTI